MSSAVPWNSNSENCAVCEEDTPEDTKSHDVSESSPGSEPAGQNNGGEKRESVSEPDTTAVADASERSVSSEFVISKQLLCLHQVCTVVNISETTRGSRNTSGCNCIVLRCSYIFMWSTKRQNNMNNNTFSVKLL